MPAARRSRTAHDKTRIWGNLEERASAALLSDRRREYVPMTLSLFGVYLVVLVYLVAGSGFEPLTFGL